MFARYILIGIIALVLTASMALADGGFGGEIEYNNCSCEWGDGGDWVKIQRVGYAQVYSYPVSCSWTPGFDTRIGSPATFPPGNYKIWVELGRDSECDKSMIQQVIHGSTDQEVDLDVLGPQGQPE